MHVHHGFWAFLVRESEDDLSWLSDGIQETRN